MNPIEIKNYMQKASPLIEFMIENTTDWSLVLWIFADMEDGSGIATSYGISINKDDDGSFTSWINIEIQHIEDYIRGHKTFDEALQYITQFIINKMGSVDKIVKKTSFGMIDFDYCPNKCNIENIIKEHTIDLTVCDVELLNNLKRAASNLLTSIPHNVSLLKLINKMYNEIQNAKNVYESLRSLDALQSWSHNCINWVSP